MCTVKETGSKKLPIPQNSNLKNAIVLIINYYTGNTNIYHAYIIMHVCIDYRE